MSEMSLLVSFPDQSENFTHGFSAGMIWQQMENGEPVIDQGYDTGIPLHEQNLEVVMRMATAKGYAVEQKPAADGWVPIRCTFAGRAKPSLRLV